MAVNTEKIIEACYHALVLCLEKVKHTSRSIWLWLGVCLAVALGIWLLSSCSTHHYFSINAEEITNPEIMYSDSTYLTNPF